MVHTKLTSLNVYKQLDPCRFDHILPYTEIFWRPLNLAKWPEMVRYKRSRWKSMT